VADPRPERGAKSKGRLEAFSDGVFAIAITLLVIEIAVPEHAGGRLLSALFEERPVYLAYFIAFMSIGIVWIEHSALTEAMERVNAGFLRLNLLLLLLVAFLPFPARVMEEYLTLGKYAEREGLFFSDAGEERAEDNRVKYQLGPSLIFYAIATLAGIIYPYLGVGLYLFIGVYLLLPVKTVKRMVGRGS
jgi:uncharacterized membrane protein